MTYKIEGDTATIKMMWKGKEEDLVIRKLTVQEAAYFFDEAFDFQVGKPMRVKIGTLILSLLPKCVEKAPFETKDLNTIYGTKLDIGSLIEVADAFMELNNMKGTEKNEEAR